MELSIVYLIVASCFGSVGIIGCCCLNRPEDPEDEYINDSVV